MEGMLRSAKDFDAVSQNSMANPERRQDAEI